MNEPKRRFFSGDTLQQALVQAANHFHLPPEEIAYRGIEKRHGFLKTRRKVLIEVDPEAPRRSAVAPPPRPAPPAPPAVAPPAPRPSSPPRTERIEQPERAEPRLDRDRRPARAEEAPSVRPPADSGGLIALPEIPRRPSERFPEATGPVAEAATRGMELLLRIAGLDLTPRILQGDERLEVDLSGEDADWCFADEGELVASVEHLLPRLIRSLAGEAPLVRVDCDNFQEIREERLRSLAQQVAEEVRRKGRPRTLEPMNPADRRIVHITLADDPGVVSESSGDGYFKRVTIRPA